MRSGSARLRDVAELAGVSVRTVSNVVNGFAHVAPDTRARVQAAVDELGYRPNPTARGLRSGRTGVVALVVPELASPYFSDLASRVVRAGEQRGLTVHIVQSDGEAERERRLLEGPSGTQVDGVVISPWALDPAELRSSSSGLPVVMLGERGSAGAVDHVTVDNEAAAREAVTHLLERGRTTVAAVGLQPHLPVNTARLRRDGYRAALREAGRPHRPELELPVHELHRADGAAAARRLLEDRAGVDAVFAFTDQLALGMLAVLLRAGVRVPDDIALVGFDDIEDGRYSVPSLTTVAPDRSVIAELALDALVARIEETGRPEPARALVAPHRLEVRESSGPDFPA